MGQKKVDDFAKRSRYLTTDKGIDVTDLFDDMQQHVDQIGPLCMKLMRVVTGGKSELTSSEGSIGITAMARAMAAMLIGRYKKDEFRSMTNLLGQLILTMALEMEEKLSHAMKR